MFYCSIHKRIPGHGSMRFIIKFEQFINQALNLICNSIALALLSLLTLFMCVCTWAFLAEVMDL